MHKIKILLIILFTVCVELPFLQAQVEEAFIQVENPTKVSELIKHYTKEVHSIQSDFIQEKHLTMMEEVLVSKGRFLFREPNQVRWEYDAPINYTILIQKHEFAIINEGKVSSFDIDGNKMFKEINHMILTAIQGKFLDGKDFTVIFQENDTRILARLTPTDPQVSSMLKTIEIYFSKKEEDINQVRFIEPGDDFTDIYFMNRLLNTSIPDSAFATKQ